MRHNERRGTARIENSCEEWSEQVSERDYYQPEWHQQQEPGPQRDYRWLIGLLAGAVVVCLFAACGVVAYFWLWPALAPPEIPPAPVIPTVVGWETTVTAVARQTVTAGGEVAPPGPAGTPEQPVGPGVVQAVRLPAPPIIDGLLEEYEGLPSVASTYRVYAASSWDGSVDLEALWRLAWDAQNLYVAVDVRDDEHVQTQTGNLIYRGDSVELQVDTEPAANASRVNPNTYQILLSPGNFASLAPSAYRFRGTREGDLVDAPGAGVAVDARPLAEGYTLEAAIPWSALDTMPEQGMVLGLALNANDNDTPGTAVQEVMLSNVRERTLTDPSSWGNLQLVGPP